MTFTDYQKTLCVACGRRFGPGRFDRKRQPGLQICSVCWDDTQRISLSETYPSTPNVDAPFFIADAKAAAQASVLPDRARRVHASFEKGKQ